MIRSLTIALTFALAACAPQGPPPGSRPPADRSVTVPPIARPAPATPSSPQGMEGAPSTPGTGGY